MSMGANLIRTAESGGAGYFPVGISLKLSEAALQHNRSPEFLPWFPA